MYGLEILVSVAHWWFALLINILHMIVTADMVYLNLVFLCAIYRPLEWAASVLC
jgi:hypothetical protein